MLSKDFITKNEGRLFWVYTVCRTVSYTNSKQLVQTFFDEDKANKYCDDMNIHPQFGKLYVWTVEKNKFVV